MLPVKEQKLLLRMYLKGQIIPKVFTRNELKEMGDYVSESGLSRTLRNLYIHFFIEYVGHEKPTIRYEDELSHIENQALIKKRMKTIRMMRKEFKETPKKKRVKFKLSEEGMLFARILMKAEKWKRQIKKLRI